MTKAKTSDQTIDAKNTTPRAAGGALSVVLLTLLHHADLARVGERATLSALAAGGEVSLSREGPLFARPASAALRPLADAHLSRTPIRLAAMPDGGVRLDPAGSRTRLTVRGEAVVAPVSWSAEVLRGGVVLRLGKDVVLLLHRVDVSDMPPTESFGLLGGSPAIHRVLREIRRAAEQETPVLVRGETGTGKELCARALHQASARRAGPFLAVNLAAVPPALAAAELFGVERGAFTGATQGRPGYFALARGGTLFLDEIGDAPTDLQAMLLRALEGDEAQTVGAGRPQRIDVRLVAATDADLEAHIRDGRFRAPLLHRLSAHEIWMPPLRDRRDDIARLLLHFLREELAAAGALHLLSPPADTRPWLPASLVARLVEADWSGNVRQLRNVARQIVAHSHDLDHAALSPAVERMLTTTAPPPRAPSDTPAEPDRERRRSGELPDDEIVAALREARWELSPAAAKLGLSRPALYRWIRKSGLARTAGDLSPDEIARSYREHGGDVARAALALEVSESALRRRIRELGLDDE